MLKITSAQKFINLLKEEKTKIVTKAIEIISNPQFWTTGPLAANRQSILDKDGNTVVKMITVDPTSPKANCWCAIGSLIKVSPNDYTVRDEVMKFCLDKYQLPLADVNDFQGRKKSYHSIRRIY
jgi:hypothetical protein